MKKSDLLICDCSSAEHQIIFRYDHEWKLVYASIHLNNSSFWSRLKNLFGDKCRYGNFEEFILTKDHIDSLEQVIKCLKDE